MALIGGLVLERPLGMRRNILMLQVESGLPHISGLLQEELYRTQYLAELSAALDHFFNFQDLV